MRDDLVRLFLVKNHLNVWRCNFLRNNFGWSDNFKSGDLGLSAMMSGRIYSKTRFISSLTSNESTVRPLAPQGRTLHFTFVFGGEFPSAS